MTSRLEYSLWKKDNQPILKELSHKKALILFSGGKDSSVVLSLMQKAQKEFNFSFETHGVIFPTNVYSDKDIKAINDYWRQRNIRITWHESEVSDDCLAEAVKEGRSPCLACIQMKKKILSSHLREMISDRHSSIVMSYSLWDLVSAMLEHITKSIFCDKNYVKAVKEKKPEERFIETAQRFYPLLKLKEGPAIYKPLIKINDQDIAQYISENEIPLTTIPCAYKDFRPKRILAAYYGKSDLYFEYDKVFDFSKMAFGLPDKSYYEELDMKKYINGAL